MLSINETLYKKIFAY